jgi:hypothetical protein
VAVIAGLPGVPGTSCPSTASALATAGLGPVCQVASGITGAAGSVAGQVAGLGVDSVLNALGNWVSEGATWLLTQVGAVLDTTTSVDLSAPWFATHYATMAALAGVVVVPLLLCGVIQSVYRQSASLLVRSVVVNVPLALVLTGVAVKLVELGLAVTDAMSSAVAQGAGVDAGHFMAPVTLALSGATATGASGVPAFVLFLGSLAVVAGAVMVWIELLIRSAAVYVAVLFLPLALASLAWPAIAHWCRRLVDTLVALILGKFVIVSVLSLAAGALAGAGGNGGGGFAAVLGGAALLILAAFSPWALFRLLPFLEAGAVGHLEGVSARARQQVAAPVRGLAQVAMRAAAAGSVAGAAGAAGTTGLAGGSLLGSASAGGSLGGGVGGGVGGGTTTAPGSGGPAGGGGAGGSGPSRGGTGGTAGRGAGQDGPLGVTSSARSTGVGTVRSPGWGIPVYPAHPEASAAVRRMMAELDDQPEPSSPDASSGGSARSAPLRPLPLQSGALHADALGRDELGIRLVTTRRTPTRPPADGPDSGG